MATGFAFRLALIAFAITSLRGLITHTDFQATIQTALIATAIFFVLGFAFGELARQVVEESVRAEFARQDKEFTERQHEIASKPA